MLQAQIDIVDESGHTEESATILGSGRVSIGKRATGGLLHADEAELDFVAVTQDGAEVVIQVKAAPNQNQGDTRIALGSAKKAFELFIEAVDRRVKVTRVVAAGNLLRGNAIIHTPAPVNDPLASSLVRRTQALAARGAVAVSQQLQRLRDQGKIDESGKLLVPFPDDMKVGSKTDL
jgi:hypothetical protein